MVPAWARTWRPRSIVHVVAGKIVLCRCEDMTLSDLEHSVSRGYQDIEEVKRYTGFGTGPCQGKECLALVASELARLTGQPPSTIKPFTSRPPLAPTPLRLLARDPGAHRFDDDREDG
ncbi:MAG: (2Fe-2S)-binding protein [Deltaproteobacteria bacterium]|nr:(2Fe-2S)-binding protein [Deltaproteobacteria bacterium]